MLKEIIAMDYDRILTRLRSQHARKTNKTRGKPLLLLQLDNALHDSSVKASSVLSKDKLQKMRAIARQLHVLGEDLESIQHDERAPQTGQHVLLKIVTKANELHLLDGLGVALRSAISMDPSVVKHLPKAVGKLSRYYSVSSGLVSAARCRRYRIFNDIEIKPYQLPGPAKITGLETSLETALQNVVRVRSFREQQAQNEALHKYFGSELSAAKAKFCNRATGKDIQWKIHAEIQLLYFYELHPEHPRPRVICSNKSACYLCDLFFKIHGKFHIARTHGKVYESWILPGQETHLLSTSNPNFLMLVEEMKAMMIEKIKSIINTGRLNSIQPDESVPVLPGNWSPSTMSKISNVSNPRSESGAHMILTLDQETPIAQLPPHPELQPVSSTTSINRPAHYSEGVVLHNQASTETVRPERADSLIQQHTSFDGERSDEATASNLVSQHVSSERQMLLLPPGSEPPPDKPLTRGQHRWKEFSRLDDSFQICARTLHATLTRDVVSTQDTEEIGDGQARCCVRVEWLDCDSTYNHSKVIDVGELAEDAEVTVTHGAATTTDTLFLSHGDDVMSIKYQYAEPSDLD